jgi:hypothetical protein
VGLGAEDAHLEAAKDATIEMLREAGVSHEHGDDIPLQGCFNGASPGGQRPFEAAYLAMQFRKSVT